ncbi:ABC transporter permease [Dactylosporangium sp. NBC_01737]|uniref:ABC transporter permease n=1 Tax=Dactylosporangium sp. NBC_01737 TaxID=2975959 RepID=UPI002E12D044|nr:ABC transporter permease [Dactylosporangium sp. NBC_01737]
MRYVRSILPPVLVGVAAIALWELVVKAGRIAPFILPAPSAIWAQLVEQRDNVVDAALASGANALVGLIGGTVVAILAALVSSRSKLLSDIAVPYAAVVNALPIIALAPILNNMFDSTSSLPRRVVAGIIAFFPVFINTLRGLREVDPTHRELMDSYAASGWTFARLVRLPGALPYVFTGLRQASSLAVIAAVVAEYFGGLQDGLGARITSAAAFTAYPRAWAFVVGACALGLVFYLTTLLLERLAMPWKARS